MGPAHSGFPVQQKQRCCVVEQSGLIIHDDAGCILEYKCVKSANLGDLGFLYARFSFATNVLYIGIHVGLNKSVTRPT